jgi:CBS domain-containing protein
MVEARDDRKGIGRAMSLEQDLRGEQVGHLDLSTYIAVEPKTRVADVLNRMRVERRNCVLVLEAGRLAGIFTDRDVLKKLVDAPGAWAEPIERWMTRDPETVRPEEPVAVALKLMIAGHYRNVPVVAADGTLCGNLTHYAIIKFLSDRFPQEIYNLPPEPELAARARDGA